MAAGTLTIAHNSGGPKLDIVVDYEDEPTGFLADSVETYAETLQTIFSMTKEEQLKIIRNARKSVDRFSEECFETGFLDATEFLFRS